MGCRGCSVEPSPFQSRIYRLHIQREDVRKSVEHFLVVYCINLPFDRLIWNLLLVGKTSIEHILQAHYRAITDINWHTTECDTVISIGIDSWLWAWDLREPRKPIFG